MLGFISPFRRGPRGELRDKRPLSADEAFRWLDVLAREGYFIKVQDGVMSEDVKGSQEPRSSESSSDWRRGLRSLGGGFFIGRNPVGTERGHSVLFVGVYFRGARLLKLQPGDEIDHAFSLLQQPNNSGVIVLPFQFDQHSQGVSSKIGSELLGHMQDETELTLSVIDSDRNMIASVPLRLVPLSREELKSFASEISTSLEHFLRGKGVDANTVKKIIQEWEEMIVKFVEARS